MLRRFLTVIILSLFCISISPTSAAERVFVWDAVVDSDLAGYRLYKSSVSGQYTLGKDWVAEAPAGTETITYNVIPDGVYYFVVTAIDTAKNESDASNEVSTTIDDTPPTSPSGLRCNILP